MKRQHSFSLAAFIVLMLCLFPLTALGNPIDVEQALKAVENYRKKPARNGARRAAALNKGKLQHAYTKSTAEGAPAVYVFNTGEGFILASADDSTVPVLGYSDNGDFDPDNIPPALQYMMGEYAKQIAALPPRKANSVTPSYNVEYSAPISPLIQTHWEQRNPYNIEFPLTGVGPAATGCVTTAMAQIMRYHKWPAKGYGSAEQDAQPVAAITHYERNYYERNYQWDLMYNTTSEIKASQASINAVSQLMMDLAVGLFTDYTGGGTSNSNSTVIPPMLLSYFNYDPSVENIPLSSCSSQEEFNNIVIADLLAGRPVYFQGGPNSAAHAYVCDGYDGEGLFHINWGWGGTDDGYYLITNLTPTAGGVGGAGGVGYSQNLVMVHNIMPNQNGVLPRPLLKAHYSTDIDPGYKLVKDGNSYYFNGNFNVFGAPDDKPRNFRGKLGLRVVDASGQETLVWESKYTQIKARNNYLGFRIDLQSSWVADGTCFYYIYKEYDADPYRTMHDTRGDVCCIAFKRNSEGEMEATCNDVAVCTIEQGTVAPINTVDVTYDIYLNNQSIGTKVVAEEVGKAPSQSFIPDYYVSATGFPSVVTESKTYRIDTEYKAGKLPFQIGKAYNILFQVNGNNYLWQHSVNVVNVKANPTSSDYANTNAQWKFSGNWLDGFIIQNAGSGYYLTAPVGGEVDARMLIANGLSYGDRQKCLLQHRSDGFYLKQKDCNLYLALTKVSTLNILLSNEKNFAGNLVTICEPGQLPAPAGVDYTISISGNPENTTPQVLYQNEWYSNEDHINAVNLGVIDLYASPIDGYTPEITIGAKTIYVEYIANQPTGRNYTVKVNAPTGKTAALYYNGEAYSNNAVLTAEGLSLMQLTATAIEGYEPDITIGSSSITVNYIPYENYTVNITGLTGTGLTASLLYAGQPYTHGQTFRAAKLTAKELFATSFSDYSHEITIGNDKKVTVAYVGYSIHFDTNSSAFKQRVHLNQDPVSVSYVSNGWANEIYKESVQYTDVTTSRGSIERIVFDNLYIEEGEIKANSGQKTGTLEWTFPEGTQSVRFTGGTATSTGLTVYLKAPDTPAPTPVVYNVNISGAPEGQNPVLYYKSKSYTHGSVFYATGLGQSQLQATEIGGYTYDISIGTDNAISVVYTGTDEPTPTTTTYTVNVNNAPAGASVSLDGHTVTGSSDTYTTTKVLGINSLSVTAPTGYYADKTYDTATHTFTVTFKAYFQYPVTVNGTTDTNAGVIYAGMTYHAGQTIMAKTTLTDTDLQPAPVTGFTGAVVIGTSGITVNYTPNAPVGTTYNVVVNNLPAGAVVTLDGQNITTGGTYTVDKVLSLADLSANEPAGYYVETSYNATSHTFTVTYHTYLQYTVVVTGTTDANAGVIYNDVTYHAGDVIQVKTALYATDVLPADVAGYEASVTLGTNTVTVTYTSDGPETYYIETKPTSGNNGRKYFTEGPISGSYYNYNGRNNIYGESWYTEVESSGNPIVKIEFANIQDFSGVWATTGTLDTSTGVWTGDGTDTYVKFFGGDGYSEGMTITLEALTAKTYTINITGPSEAKLIFSGTEYANNSELVATGLKGADLSATDISGYSYVISINGNVINVVYTEDFHPQEGVPYTLQEPTTGLYLNVFHNTGADTGPNTKDVVLKAEPQTLYFYEQGTGFYIKTEDGLYVGKSTANTWNMSANTPELWAVEPVGTGYALHCSSGYLGFNDGYTTVTNPPAFRDKPAKGRAIFNIAEVTSITYTLIVNNLPAGAAVSLDGQDLTTGGTYSVSKVLSLSDLSVTEPDGYYADKTYDQSTHTFTVTFHACYSYNVVVAGTSNAAAGVIYNGVTYRDGATIQSKTPLYATSVTPISITGQEGSVTFENNTFTVTYRLMKAVDVYFYKEGASSGRLTHEKENVSVTCWTTDPSWQDYARANIYNQDNFNMVVSSESTISKIEMYRYTGETSVAFSNLSCSNGYIYTNGECGVWEGSTKSVTFSLNTSGDIYLSHLVIYIAGPTEHEQALQEIEEARVEIADGTLGYPVLTQELRNDPNMAAYVQYYDAPTAYTGTLAALQASYDYFLTHTTEVNTPVAGHAYKLSVRSSDGKRRWYLTNYGSVSETAADAAVFVMGGTGNEDYNTLFATNDNSQSHYLQNNGATAEAYTADACDFSLTSMLQAEQGTLVSTQPARRLGTFSLKANARHDDANLVGVMVLDESTHEWSNSENPFMNGSYTSAIEMEEVEYPYTKPKLTAGKEGSHEGVFASIWLPFPMIFPEGVEVYKGTQQHTTGGQSYLALERVDTDHAVAKGGYILYSPTLSAGEIEVLPAPSSPDDAHDTGDAVFIGSTDLNADGSSLYWTKLAGQNPYVLADKSKGIGFYRYVGTTFPKGKAIWLAPEDEGSETVRFGFEDVIEAIKSLHGHGTDTLIYDLNGHRLDKVQKGQVNVVNGKKIMIK